MQPISAVSGMSIRHGASTISLTQPASNVFRWPASAARLIFIHSLTHGKLFLTYEKTSPQGLLSSPTEGYPPG